LSVVDLKVQDDLTVTDDVAIGGLATVGGTLAVTGVVTANAGVVVDEMTLDADTLTATDTFTIDAAGDITLDADGADIRLSDAGTQFGKFTNSSSDFVISSSVNDKDMIFKGADGGADITALTLDMSQAGRATFNEGIVAGTSTAGAFGLTLNTASGDNMTLSVADTGSGGAALGTISVSDGGLTLDSASTITLDADNAAIALKDGGVQVGSINMTSSDLQFVSEVSDKDMKFTGNDGGSFINALTLDMSDAGAATFNGSVTVPSGSATFGTSTLASGLVKLDHENSGGQAQFQINAHGTASFSMFSNFSGGTISGVPTGGFGLITPHSAAITFSTADTARMTLNSSGHLLIGKTADDNTTEGIALHDNGFMSIARSGNVAQILQRSSSSGDILRFQSGGTTVGNINSVEGVRTAFVFDPRTNGSGLCGATLQIQPTNNGGGVEDNIIALGSGTTRFDDAFITNGVTTGSDRNEKQDIAALTSAEMLVAARISQTFHTYRWKDAVADKGDNARIHTGTIAQEVQAAFAAEGLDVSRYAMFMSDTWWEHDVDVAAVEADDIVVPPIEAADAYTRTDTYDTEDEAPSGSTSKTRLGIRYPELLSFLAAYNEQRFAAIETRLTALEG